jgi:hypothetical protein
VIFGESYHYFGGLCHTFNPAAWSVNQIRDCLTQLNEAVGPDFNTKQKSWRVKIDGIMFLLYWGFWTGAVGFPVEPTTHTYVLWDPRTRHKLDQISNFLSTYFRKNVVNDK